MPYSKDMAKYLITGASGQLGYELQRVFGGDGGNALPRAREAFDITDTDLVMRRIATVKPDAVINCAAYTNVPQAERDREICWRANALGVDNLARACVANDIPLFHVSTDFVFGQDFTRCFGSPADLRKPVIDPATGLQRQPLYTESCPVGPVGFYALSKVAGEHAILARAADHPSFRYAIVRTAGLFERPWRQINNFPYKIARKILKSAGQLVPVVRDVFTNVCYAPHLATAIKWMVENRDEWHGAAGPVVPSGVYHVANTGHASWFEIAQRIATRFGRGACISALTRREYASSLGLPESSSPSFTCLNLDKYHETSGPPMPTWQAAIDEWCTLAQRYFK